MQDHPYIEVTAYKAFEEQVRLELRPLTVVFGNNGAGKSALIRLPLQLAAALRPAEGAAAGLPLAARGLSFGRSYLDLRHGGIADRLQVGFTFHKSRLSAWIERDPQTPAHLPGQRVHSWEASGCPEGAANVQTAMIEASAQGGWTGRIGPGERRFEVRSFRGLIPTGEGLSPFGPILFEFPAVDHLGPSRHPGSADFLPSSPTLQRHVGLDGGLTQEVLASLRTSGAEASLKRIQAWLAEWLGVELRLTDVQAGSTPGTVIEGRRGGPWLPLNEFGTGLRHALPVVVQQALAAEGENLAYVFGALHVVEEPEAHLRPDVQAGLADLFLDAARAGVRFSQRTIVETHSEAFLLRLQRRVAEEPSLRDLIGLAHVDDRGGTTVVHNLQISADGDLPGLPDGWFDASLHESQAIFAARRRRA